VKVTVFEAQQIPGGMISIAPVFRLPAKSVHEDIGRIVRMGVELKVGQPSGFAAREAHAGRLWCGNTWPVACRRMPCCA